MLYSKTSPFHQLQQEGAVWEAEAFQEAVDFPAAEWAAEAAVPGKATVPGFAYAQSGWSRKFNDKSPA